MEIILCHQVGLAEDLFLFLGFQKNPYLCLFINRLMMRFLEGLFILQSTTETDDGFTARLLCNHEHPVYQAHFPGNPITPGACLLQTAGELLQQKLKRQLFLKSAKNIKYLNVLVPAAEKVVRYTFSNLAATDTECKVQVVIADESSVYTKMSLTFSYEPV